MKKLLVLFAVLALASCGKESVEILQAGPAGPPGTDGIGCTLDGSIITCADGSSFDLEGLQGMDGLDGLDGAQGDQGPQGDSGVQGDPGPQGDPGAAGNSGVVLTDIYDFPVKHECKSVGEVDLYAVRACSIIRIYNNSTCDSSPLPKKVLCSLNPVSNEVCWVDKTLFVIEGSGNDTLLYRLDF